MKLRAFLAIICAGAFVSIPGSRSKAAEPANLILIHGQVLTSDPAHLNAQALAIRGQHIVAVGTSDEMLAFVGPNTRQIDLKGHRVVPGFNDAHFHHLPNPPGFQLKLTFPEPTWNEVLEALSDAQAHAPKDCWIYGDIGSFIVNLPQATRGALDRLSPDHPVFLHSWFGHGHIMNSLALHRLGITEEEPDPIGGQWVRDPVSKRITGKFFDYAGWPLLRHLEDSASDEQIMESLHQLGEDALHYGVTSIQNMTYMPLPRYIGLLAKGKFPVRMRLIRWPATDLKGPDLTEGVDLPLHPADAPLVTVRGTKWMLDGTPLERGMAVRGEYVDRPKWSGTLAFSEQDIGVLLRDAIARDDQSLFHASGDKTVQAILHAMVTVDPDESHWPARRVRIEHGDGLFPDLIPIAKRLGVVVVQNPTHFDPAMNPLIARFGPNSRYLPLRSLLEAGIPLALGSDGPMNPGLNLMLAVIDPLRPDEAISMPQAIAAYTAGSAYAEFEDGEKGTLAPGKLADLAVLSQDILNAPPPELPKTTSVLTIVDGKIAYDAGVLNGESTSGR